MKKFDTDFHCFVDFRVPSAYRTNDHLPFPSCIETSQRQISPIPMKPLPPPTPDFLFNSLGADFATRRRRFLVGVEEGLSGKSPGGPYDGRLSETRSGVTSRAAPPGRGRGRSVGELPGRSRGRADFVSRGRGKSVGESPAAVLRPGEFQERGMDPGLPPLNPLRANPPGPRSARPRRGCSSRVFSWRGPCESRPS